MAPKLEVPVDAAPARSGAKQVASTGGQGQGAVRCSALITHLAEQ